MRHRSFLILFVYFLSIGSSIAEEKALPFELLGQNVQDILPQFRESMSDADGYWFVIDKDRCYLRLLVEGEDFTVSAIYISDPCYSTEENIRVGASFSQVRAAYPDAEFRAGQEGAATGVYDLVIQDGQIAFWFDAYAIRQRINEGEKIGTEHAMVQKMKLTLIHIRGERDKGKGTGVKTDPDSFYYDVIGSYYGRMEVMIDGLNSEQVADVLYQSGNFNRVSSYTDGRRSARADYLEEGAQGRFIDWIWQGY